MNNSLPKYIYLYFFGQSINLIIAVVSVTVIGFVGIHIAPNPIYATIPYGFQFLLLFLGTYPIAMVMKKYGRKTGFFIGALALFTSGVIGFFAIKDQNFILLIITHGLIGLFSASANFYRYAVTDNLHKSQESKALSLVVSSGVIAGFLGPTIAVTLSDLYGYPKFSLCYLVFAIFAILNLLIIVFLPNQKSDSKTSTEANKNNKITKKNKVNTNTNIYIAIGAASLGYGLMNLLMIQSSLKMNHMHISFDDSSFAIQWHVISMFFPSFFTGYLISKTSHLKIINFGLMMFILCFVINLTNPHYISLMFSLIALGVAWNFTYIGGSSMLTSSFLDNDEKVKWQGIGDTLIAIFATLGAFLPSFLLNSIGWEYSNLLSLCLCVILILSIYILNRRKQ